MSCAELEGVTVDKGDVWSVGVEYGRTILSDVDGALFLVGRRDDVEAVVGPAVDSWRIQV